MSYKGKIYTTGNSEAIRLDKNDPYAIFSKCLRSGKPPTDLDELLDLCTDM